MALAPNPKINPGPEIFAGMEKEMTDSLPANDYYDHFAPDFSLHIPLQKDMENRNKRDVLDKVSHIYSYT